MGSFLDSSKDLRQIKESPSRKAYKSEKKLEKDKDEGLRVKISKYAVKNNFKFSIKK